MPSTAPVQLAVIGSGPAGCFFAQSLLRSSPATKITVFDRLPSPFGLVRYGVAADHQHTKAITRQFERLFADERVSFAGNIAIGRDLSLHELREHWKNLLQIRSATTRCASGVSGCRCGRSLRRGCSGLRVRRGGR